MKGSKKWFTGILVILIVVFGAVTVHAQEIVFTGEACPLTIYNNGAEPFEVAVESVNVLGIVDGEYAAVLYQDENGSQAGYVSVEELIEKVPSLDLASLPAVENWTNLISGSSGDMVQMLQEILINRGFMSGNVDGVFGPRTTTGVNAFLASVGLSQDGSINAIEWFLLLDDGTTEAMTVAYPPVYTVEEKFAPILGAISDASMLEGFVDPSWTLSYDAFDQQGVIRRVLDVEPYVNEEKAIDRITVELGLGVYLQASSAGSAETSSTAGVSKMSGASAASGGAGASDEIGASGEPGAGGAGTLDCIPVLLVHTVGAYRPYIKSVTLNCGGTVVDLSVLKSTSEVKGSDVIEETYLVLSEEAITALLSVDADASLEVRLRGANRNYDMDMSAGVGEVQEFVGAWE